VTARKLYICCGVLLLRSDRALSTCGGVVVSMRAAVAAITRSAGGVL
jgi:hypothetical protein